MKVLYITNIPSPYMVNLFNELGKYCDLTVLYERENASDRDKSWFSKNEVRTYKSFTLSGIKFGHEAALNISILPWLRKDYDIFVTGYSSPTGMLTFDYLRLLKKTFIFNADGGIVKKDTLIKFLLKKHFIGGASYYLSSGKVTADYLVHYGAKKERIFYYPFSSLMKNDFLKKDLSPDEKTSYKEKFNIKQKKMVLSVGQFIYRKGFDVLINSCINLQSDIGVYIVGGVPPKEYLQLIEKLDLHNITFMSFLDKSTLLDLYKAADVFVLPTREDVWGLVINEAMSQGLPIITTDRCVAGLELVENGKNGFIVKINDPVGLAEKINRIVLNDELQKKMSAISLKKIAEYTIENIAMKHLQLFNEIEKSKNVTNNSK
jgi:glycosyltransferase involved in cell wall biosynthesis